VLVSGSRAHGDRRRAEGRAGRRIRECRGWRAVPANEHFDSDKGTFDHGVIRGDSMTMSQDRVATAPVHREETQNCDGH